MDDTKHQRVCENDSSHIEVAEHKAGEATCIDPAICSDCGDYYGEPLGHDWPEENEGGNIKIWKDYDNNRLHMQECIREGCSYRKYAEHRGAGGAAFACGPNVVKCVDCGKETTGNTDHEKTGVVSDETHHWTGCKNCAAKIDKEEHKYPNQTVGKEVPQTCEICKYGGYITKLEDSEFGDHHLTPALKKKYGNRDAIEKKMHEEMAAVESWEGAPKDTKLYEVELMYSDDGGLSWLPASEKHFPKDENGKRGKLAVTLPVEQDIDKHDFKVFHMFSKDMYSENGSIEKKAGDIETPDVSEFKIGNESYITFYVTGLSPIMVAAWEEAEETTNGNTTKPNINKQPKADVDQEPETETDAISGIDSEDVAQALNMKLKVTQKGRKIQVKYGKVEEADGYDIYVQRCGTKFDNKATKVVKNENKLSARVKTVNGKELDLKKKYKVYVAAYKNVNGEKVRLGRSIGAHIVGHKNAKYTNPKKIKVSNKEYVLTEGQKVKLEAKTVKFDRKKKELSDAHVKKFRYWTSDRDVAFVTENGRINAAGKGECTIMVHARSGHSKTIKVTVQ